MFKRVLMLTCLICAGTLFADAVAIGHSRNGFPLIVPQPKKLTVAGGSFALPAKLTVAAPKGLDIAPLAKVYAETVADGKVERSASGAVCRFELADKDVPKSPEGYTLAVTGSGIVVRARDVRGLYYGMQTLNMLLRHRDTAASLPRCNIIDWPDLEMRGWYLQLYWVTPDQIDRICHVIDTFGSLKYNTLLVGFEDNFPFKDSPFTGRKHPLSRADVEKLLTAARRNHMEIIPKMQLISHAAWLANHRDWAKFSELKSTRIGTSVYCLSNPEVLPIVEKVITEISDFVKPRYFHIGLDEIYECGFPKCRKCRKADPAKLMLDHLRPVCRILAKRGITPIVYQDQFFGFGELSGKKHDKIADVPKRLGCKTAIMSWEYGRRPDARLAGLIKEAGFKDFSYMSFAINLDNCQNLPKLAARVGAKGNFLAYWSIVPSAIRDHDQRRSVFYASTVAQANYCWNSRDAEMSRIPMDSARLLRELLDGKPEFSFRGKAVTLPLDGSFNQALNDTRMFPDFDAETLEQIKAIAAADPAKFEFRTDNGAPLAVVLSGCPEDGLPTGPVTIPVNTKASGASFLVTAAAFNNVGITDDGNWFPIGGVEVVYANGKRNTFPLDFRRNINDWNSFVGGNTCRAVVRGNDRNGALFSLYAIDWRNPHPEREIKEIVLTSKGDTMISPVLFSCSLSDAEKTPFAGEVRPFPARKTLPAPRKSAAVSFRNGIPAESRCAADWVGSGFEYRVVRDAKLGKVLEFRIQDAPVFSRALADLTIKEPRDFGSIVFALKVSDWRAIYRPDLFVMNRNASKVLGAPGYFTELDGEWHTICIPRSRIVPKEGGGIDPKAAEVIRLGFFLQQVRRPLIIRMGDVYFCDRVLPCRINLTNRAK